MIRRLVVLVALVGVMDAQEITTRIVDTLYAPDGALLNATIQIESMRLERAARTVIPRTVTARITNGQIDLRLAPNAGSRPEGTSYRATYIPDGGQRSWSEYWVVPASTAPVTVAQVWVATRPTRGSGGAVATPSCQAVYSDIEEPSGAVDGLNAAFTLASSPVSAGGVLLYRNGLLQKRGDGGDYDLAGNLITFRAASIPQPGDILAVVYRVSGACTAQ